MQAGFHFWNYTVPGEPQTLPDALARTARAAEDGGFAQFTVMDHWFQMEAAAPATDPMMEAFTTLGFVAASTSRMRIGPLVAGVTYRYPALLAKTVTTLDVLSRGRAMLGIGAAWYEREHRGLGVPYPALAERFERLEEALQIALQMWSDDDGPYRGEHYALEETLNRPRAVSTPHPPIMIGGKGERKTMRLAAQYAQIVNLTTADPAEVERVLGALRAHCERLGTDYEAIEKTTLAGPIDPFSDAFLPRMRELAALGVTQVVLRRDPSEPDPARQVTRLAEDVLPRLAEI
jgi:F420-dependent oxidoreductase-like protein